MQQGFPITVRVDEKLSQVGPITSTIEAWINFQALKSGWFADEACILSFDFVVVSPSLFTDRTAGLDTQNWTVETDSGLAFCHDRKQLKVEAFIALGPVGFEEALKMKLVEVANRIVGDYGFSGISA